METAALSLENVSILIPVIRPQNLTRLFRSLVKYGYDEVEICSLVDEDRIGCPKMIKKLAEMASNDIVVFLGDDTVMQENCLEEALKVMQTFEGGWGLVGLNDMQTPNPTHWMAHKKLLPEIGGEFFHTGYTHCFCDDELRFRSERIGRYKWCEDAKIKHYHPLFGTSKWDDDYKRVYTREVFKKDEKLFYKRNKLAK